MNSNVMVNFQLGELNVKDEMINNDTKVGKRKKKSESPTGTKPPASRTGPNNIQDVCVT